MKLVEIRNKTVRSIFNYVNDSNLVSYDVFGPVSDDIMPRSLYVWKYRPIDVENVLDEISEHKK